MSLSKFFGLNLKKKKEKAAADRGTIITGVRRYPDDVREELDKALKRNTWQALTREFSIDTFTGLEKEGLDCIPKLIDSTNYEFIEDVKKKIDVLKYINEGKAQCFKGRSRIGFNCSFYRFLLLGERRENGLYDILFCYISRKEDFDLFLFINKLIQGTAHVLKSTPQAFINMLPDRVRDMLQQGMIEDREEPSMYAHRELTQELGDRLTEYELIEMLIERGNLEPRSDGNMALKL